jgi:hypothetical protein
MYLLLWLFAVTSLVAAFVFFKGIDCDYYYQLEIERGGENDGPGSECFNEAKTCS